MIPLMYPNCISFERRKIALSDGQVLQIFNCSRVAFFKHPVFHHSRWELDDFMSFPAVNDYVGKWRYKLSGLKLRSWLLNKVLI